MSVERPVLMSAPMMRATLAGAKTQTRRLLRPQPIQVRDCGASVPCANLDDWIWEIGKGHDLVTANPAKSPTILKHCRLGVPGDRLWCQETWAVDESLDLVLPTDLAPGMDILYTADGHRVKPKRSFDEGRRRPSIFMQRWMSRAVLELTGVRVERLQDISEADAKAEGSWYAIDEEASWHVDQGGRLEYVVDGCSACGGDPHGIAELCHPAMRGKGRPWACWFATLWDSINDKDGKRWTDNPFVFVLSWPRFER